MQREFLFVCCFFVSERCLQECEMWPWKLCCHIYCSILHVQVQAPIQTTQLQQRSIFFGILCFVVFRLN